MHRADFVALLSLGTGAVFTGCLGGCKKDGDPTSVDFTLDLTAPANAALGTVGGYVYAGPSNNVIVARAAAATYVAAARHCTHQQTSLQFTPGTNHFKCPDHNAEFATDGSVARSPDTGSATKLQVYTVTQSGNTLHVKS